VIEKLSMVFREDQISTSFDIHHSNSNIKDKSHLDRVICLQKQGDFQSSEKKK